MRDASRCGSPPPRSGGKGLGWGARKLATERKPRKPDTRIPRARTLRRDTTPAERKLWWHLRSLSRSRSHFRRQATIGPYFADFACHDLRVVIELDGGQHGRADQMIADAKRSEIFEERGYRVLRFWNNEVQGNIEGVLSVIQSALDIAAASHPPPPPRHASRGRRGQPAAPSDSLMNDLIDARSCASSNDTHPDQNVRDAERRDSPPPAQRRGGVGGGGN
ncbi:MAG TPA: endonuclease domain-containing protein [Xanthobacteraceae bacterium]|nr:endonuclease domain-containing protein [Xanthobacteraceae bacterium]